MELRVIRNKKMLEEYKKYLSELPLPLKVASQSVSPGRTVEANAYLWGVVYKMIADEVGSSVIDVHEGFKAKYNFRYDFIFNPTTNRFEVDLGVQSTTRLDIWEFWQYIYKVRAEGEIDLHLRIPMPNEVFENRLTFEE